jgi:hypothetical protein
MKLPPGVEIHRGFLQTGGLAELASTQQLRPCPPWLGNFSFRIYGDVYGRYHGELPLNLRIQAQRMAQLVPNEVFNACFLQRYRAGELVKPHRDPANNINCTLIGIFGDFQGATTTVAGKEFQVRAGDVVKLPCTVNGVRGPEHQVSAVTSGTRWALILNAIV